MLAVSRDALLERLFDACIDWVSDPGFHTERRIRELLGEIDRQAYDRAIESAKKRVR